MPLPQPHRRMTGFSLMELLVGMMIALIAFVFMMKLFADSENTQRNVSSGADAQINGGIALFALGRELRFTGYGLTSDAVLGCNLIAHNSNRTPANFTLDALRPIAIFSRGIAAVLSSDITLPAGDSNSDMIVIAYGNADLARESITFNDKTSDTDYSGYLVKNRTGFQIGDLVIAAESGRQCTLLQVSALPGSTTVCNDSVDGKSNVIRFGTGSFENPYSSSGSCTTVSSSPYNLATPAVTYSTSGYSATLSNLGPEPHLLAYAIRSGNLTYCDIFASDCSDVSQWGLVASNIVGLQAMYGWDTSSTADGLADEYSANIPSGLTAKSSQCQASRISSIQIGLLARNTLMEKTVVTSNQPSWQGGHFTLSHLNDWQNYRYKVFETIIPLRNMVWKGSISGC